MPDKLTDKEIKEAVKNCRNISSCNECILCNNLCEIDHGGVPAFIVDLINRQDEELNRLQAENERLKEENKLLIDNDVRNKYPNCVLVEKGRIYTRTLEDYDELIADISAEAYKEFAARLDNKAMFPQEINDDYAVGLTTIKKILKELVGEDDA